jgi:hypothetical protein
MTGIASAEFSTLVHPNAITYHDINFTSLAAVMIRSSISSTGETERFLRRIQSIRARLKAHLMHGAKREHTSLKIMQSIAEVRTQCGLFPIILIIYFSYFPFNR